MRIQILLSLKEREDSTVQISTSPEFLSPSFLVSAYLNNALRSDRSDEMYAFLSSFALRAKMSEVFDIDTLKRHFNIGLIGLNAVSTSGNDPERNMEILLMIMNATPAAAPQIASCMMQTGCTMYAASVSVLNQLFECDNADLVASLASSLESTSDFISTSEEGAKKYFDWVGYANELLETRYRAIGIGEYRSIVVRRSQLTFGDKEKDEKM